MEPQKLLKWAFGGVGGALLIFLFQSFFPSPPLTHTTSQLITVKDINTSGSTGSPVHINQTIQVTQVDTDELARKLVAKIPDQKRVQDQEEEIQRLKETIERLKGDSTDELKQAALKALKKGDIAKTTELMEKSTLARIQKAKQKRKEALQLNKEAIHLEKDAAQEWIDIGNIAYLADSINALKYYEYAIKIDPSSWKAWNRIGYVFIRTGYMKDAENAYEKVMEIGKEDDSILAVVYGNLGHIYEIQGNLNKAKKSYLESRKLFESIGNKEGMIRADGNLAIIYSNSGELDKAKEHFNIVRIFFESIDDRDGMAITYNNLGDVYKMGNDIENADKFYQKALEIFEKMGDDDKKACIYSNLCGLYKDNKNDLNKAEKFCWKAVKIHKAIGNKEWLGYDYENLGSLYNISGNTGEACEFWRKSLEIYIAIEAKLSAQRVNVYFAKSCKDL